MVAPRLVHHDPSRSEKAAATDQALDAFLDSLIPKQLAGQWQARFLVRMWAFGILFALAFGGLALMQGLYFLAGALAVLVLGGVGNLLLLQSTARVDLVVNTSLAIVTPVLAVAGLLQNPPNPLSPVFLVLVPLLAGFMLSRRLLWFWLVVASTFGGITEWMMANGFHVHGTPRPNAGVVTALNLVALVVLVVAFVRWVDTMRTDMVQRLEAASRARTLFLANVSHEIRTPMNGVLGLTELVLAGNLEPEQREKLELAQRSGVAMVALIDDLLLLTRAESGRLVLTPTAVPTRKLMSDVVDLYRVSAEKAGLTLVSKVEATVPPAVELDGVRYQQVVTNLLSNALKFGERGTVELKLEREGNQLLLSVRDEGAGIGPQVLERLFKPFEQAHDGASRNQGSGLGLALTKQLVEQMGGTITVDSQPGRGSRFLVKVPCIEAPMPPPTELPEEQAIAPRLRVLVVDDNPVNLCVASGLAERAGCSVHLARSGLEALEAVRQHEFSLVFMDCQMPGMDGYEATRRIRELKPDPRLRIVALTATGGPDEHDACLRAGMDDFMVKPVSLAMVKRAVAACE
ncbi:MAG: ATP-binding protein [Archangium sp.]